MDDIEKVDLEEENSTRIEREALKNLEKMLKEIPPVPAPGPEPSIEVVVAAAPPNNSDPMSSNKIGEDVNDAVRVAEKKPDQISSVVPSGRERKGAEESGAGSNSPPRNLQAQTRAAVEARTLVAAKNSVRWLQNLAQAGSANRAFQRSKGDFQRVQQIINANAARQAFQKRVAQAKNDPELLPGTPVRCKIKRDTHMYYTNGVIQRISSSGEYFVVFKNSNLNDKYPKAALTRYRPVLDLADSEEVEDIKNKFSNELVPGRLEFQLRFPDKKCAPISYKKAREYKARGKICQSEEQLNKLLNDIQKGL